MTETTIELVPLCFYCGGNPKFDVMLISTQPNEQFIMLEGTKPCTTCAMLMNGGVTLFEMADKPGEGWAKFDDEWYFTGRWVVAHKDKAKGMFGGKIPPEILKQGYALLTVEQFKQGGCDVNPGPKH